MALNTTGFQNTAVGYNSLSSNTTGGNNTCIGRFAGQSVTTGGNNLCLGNHAGKTSSPSGEISTASDQVCLGDNSITNAFIKVAFQTGSDKRDKTDITIPLLDRHQKTYLF